MKYENKSDGDFEITATESTHPFTGMQYTHPSFGMISVIRQTGGSTPLFGSEISSSTTMNIQISECEVRQDLGRNWYYDRKIITEVQMTPVQYSEMITNPNTSGIPCTIKYTQEHGHINYKPIDTVAQYVESKVEQELNATKEVNKKSIAAIKELLNKKGTITKSDRESILNLASAMSRNIDSNIPFLKDSYKKSIEKQKLEAKAEIHAYITHVIASAGVKALNDKDVIQLMISKSKDEGDQSDNCVIG